MRISVEPPLPGLQDEIECSPSPAGSIWGGWVFTLPWRNYGKRIILHHPLPGLQDEDDSSSSPAEISGWGCIFTLNCQVYRMRISVYPTRPGLQDEGWGQPNIDMLIWQGGPSLFREKCSFLCQVDSISNILWIKSYIYLPFISYIQIYALKCQYNILWYVKIFFCV